MKTFRDLKIGDYIYVVYDSGQKCIKRKIIDIVDNRMYVNFVYNDEFPWECISIPECHLRQNEWGNIFADTTKILEYVNESV